MEEKPRTRRTRRWKIAGLVGLVFLALMVGGYFALRATGLLFSDRLPVRFALPAPSGDLEIGVAELHLIDERPDPWVEGRPRELMVSIWYPAARQAHHRLAPYMHSGAASHFAATVLRPLRLHRRVDIAAVRTHAWKDAPVAAPAPLPVVLFSPGGSLPRSLGTIWVEDLASRGYVVVAIDHTYEASEVEFPDGRVAVRTLPDVEGLLKRMIAERVRDVRFVLNELEAIREAADTSPMPLPAGLPAALDLSRVGMFGHSAGGFTAAEAMLVDERIDAGVNMDGSMAYSMSRGEFGESVTRGLARPFMLMGAGASGGPTRPHTHLHARDWRTFWDRSSGWKLDLYIPEGEHFTFTDYQAIAPQLVRKTHLPGFITSRVLGTVDPDRVVRSVREYMAAFFDATLKDMDPSLLTGPSPMHPDVDFIE